MVRGERNGGGRVYGMVRGMGRGEYGMVWEGL